MEKIRNWFPWRPGRKRSGQPESDLDAGNREPATNATGENGQHLLRIGGHPGTCGESTSAEPIRLVTQIDAKSTLPGDPVLEMPSGHSQPLFFSSQNLDLDATQQYPQRSTAVKRRNLADDPAPVAQVFNRAHNFMLRDVIVNSCSLSGGLSVLPNPIGTSWDPSRACLYGTRVDLVKEALHWMSTIPVNKTAEVYFIADAVGTGKTALAHTLAREARTSGILVASFFFDQLNREKSSTRSLLGALVHGLCASNKEARHTAVALLEADTSLSVASPTQQFYDLVLPICEKFPPDKPLAIVIDALDEGNGTDLIAIFSEHIPRLPPMVRVVLTSRPTQPIMSKLKGRSHIRISSRSLSGANSLGDIGQYIEREFLDSEELPPLSPQLKDALVQKSQGLFLWIVTVLSHAKNTFDAQTEITQILDGGSTFWQMREDAGQKLDDLFHEVVVKLDSRDTGLMAAYTKVVGAIVTVKEPLSPEPLSHFCGAEGVPVKNILGIASRIQPLLVGFDRNSPQSAIQLVHLSVREYLTKRAPTPFRIDAALHHAAFCSSALTIIDQELDPHQITVLGFTQDPNLYFNPALSDEQVSAQLRYSCKSLMDHVLETRPRDFDPEHIPLLLRVLYLKGRELLEITALMGSVLDIGTLRQWALDVFSVHKGPLGDSFSLDFNTAAAAFEVGRWLALHQRFREATAAYKTCMTMRRSLCPTPQDEGNFYLNFAASLSEYSDCLKRLGDHCAEVDVIEESLTIYRRLAAQGGPVYNKYLVDSLFELLRSLEAAGRGEEGLIVAREIVSLIPELKTDDIYLAWGLWDLSDDLSALGECSSAIGAIEGSVAIYRQLGAQDCSSWLLVNALVQHSACLEFASRDQDALVPIREAAELARKLASEDAERQAHLAQVLYVLSQHLSAVEDYSAAVEAVKESVAIYRKLGHVRSRALTEALIQLFTCLENANSLQEAVEAARELVTLVGRLPSRTAKSRTMLASTFRIFSDYLSESVRDYNGAAEAMKRSVSILREPTVQGDPIDEVQLADALYGLSIRLKDAGRDQEAVDAAQEMVALNRKLADKGADDQACLARVLSFFSERLLTAGDRISALAAIQEAVDIFCLLAAKDDGTVCEEEVARALQQLSDVRQRFDSNSNQSSNTIAEESGA